MTRPRPGPLRRRWRATRRFLSRDVWTADLGGVPSFRRLLYKLARVAFLVGKGINEHKLLMRAGSLTFITVLSIVPLLAFAFSVAKGLGAYETLQTEVIQPFLARSLAGAEGSEGGVQVREAIDDLFRIVEETDLSGLGGFGLAILLYTIVKLLASIERTFNDIWGVRRSRSFVRRVSDYLSICIVVPILLTTATAVSAAIQSPDVLGAARERLGTLFEMYARFSSLLAVWVGFTFVYLFMPNTRVRFRSAVLGGLVGGFLWQLAQVLHVRFQVGVANYNAIYSTFAALPIFLFWLYTSWVTVLLGAEVAFAHQNEPAYRNMRRARAHDQLFLESLGVRAAARVARRFLRGEPPATTLGLADELGVPEASIEEVADPLVAAGILARSEVTDDEPALLPGRDPDRVRLVEVLDAVGGRQGEGLSHGQESLDRAVSEALERLEAERAESAGNVTLRTLALRGMEERPGSAGELEPAVEG